MAGGLGISVVAYPTTHRYSGHEIKIVLWGNCALRFNGDTIRTLGQTEAAVAIFVGATVQEYDGTLLYINSFALDSVILFILFLYSNLALLLLILLLLLFLL